MTPTLAIIAYILAGGFALTQLSAERPRYQLMAVWAFVAASVVLGSSLGG